MMTHDITTYILVHIVVIFVKLCGMFQLNYGETCQCGHLY